MKTEDLKVSKIFRRPRDELPALPSAEDEEVKVVRQKLKEQGVRLKEKEAQLARLRELNRELRRANKASGQGQGRPEDMEEVRRTLADRENKLQVRDQGSGNIFFVTTLPILRSSQTDRR